MIIYINIDLCLDLDTVEPPLTVTSLQHPPLYNAHLSTTATFFGRQGGHFGEVKL